LRHALETMAQHIHRHNEALAVTVVERDGFVAIREETLLDRGQAVRQAVEMAMGTTFRVLGIFLGERWRPHAVTFRHAAPANRSWHRQMFGEAVHFGAEFNDIVCRAADLEAPNPGADPIMARYAQGLLQGEHDSYTRMSDRVRRLIVLMLPRKHCRVDVVAQHLGVSRRTVSSYLAAEHTTFSALVDDMRIELLAQYRADGQRSLSEVAQLLGFSELSAFSRWHRQRLGAPARTLARGYRMVAEGQ
jgi:AraC-like DNA-binding protein